MFDYKVVWVYNLVKILKKNVFFFVEDVWFIIYKKRFEVCYRYIWVKSFIMRGVN